MLHLPSRLGSSPSLKARVLSPESVTGGTGRVVVPPSVVQPIPVRNVNGWRALGLLLALCAGPG